jgi:hypothetical protein
LIEMVVVIMIQLKGDYPSVKDGSEAYGDQMVYWVFNDKGNVHNETNGNPLGVQINALAFAFRNC